MRHHVDMPQLLAALSGFRGAASATEVVAAAGRGARAAGWGAWEQPMSDGGEGFLDAAGGRSRRNTVRGPLGERVEAEWRWLGSGSGGTAVIEMARASGIELLGGASFNDAVGASTAGTGELILAAASEGARRIIVGCGGSATTDGGWGALEAMGRKSRLAGVEILVACDVKTGFEDAAREFAAQKGATPAQVALLSARLRRLSQLYRDKRGVDVTELEGAGAGGGLAGGLASIGAKLICGFDLVADLVGLSDQILGADLVLTGEGHIDPQSFDCKVVGGVTSMAEASGVSSVIIAANSDPGPWNESCKIITIGDDLSPPETLLAIEREVSQCLLNWRTQAEI